MRAQEIRHAERVDVARIILDARVVDSKGSPIRGLSAYDFKAEIDGRPVRIESAQWVGAPDEAFAEQPARNDRIDGTGSPGRLIVFFFQKDLRPSRAVGLLRMLRESGVFLSTLAPQDRVAVLSFDSHLKLWVDFTNDHERLQTALKRSIIFDDAPPIESPGSGSGRSDSKMTGSRDPAPPSLAVRLDGEEAKRAASVEKGLLLMARALEPLSGSKSLVLFGWGFGRLGATRVEMLPAYEPARRALTAARVAVFALDITDADYHSLEAGLQTVAEETGGFYAKTHDFSETAMHRLEGALAGHYVLILERPDRPHGAHTIKVELVSQTGTVLARNSYMDRN